MPLPSDWQSTLRAVLGGAPVPRPAARVMARRLERYGYHPPSHNWGRVLCRAPHAHGADELCTEVDGQHLTRYATPEEGLGRLVELCCLHAGHQDAVSGFRSTHPQGNETAGILDALITLAAPGTAAVLGPNAEANRTYQDLEAQWAALETRPGVDELKRNGGTRTSYESWLAFRDRWRGGDFDTTDLAPQVANLNVARGNLGQQAVDLKPPDAASATAANSAAAKVDDVVKSAENDLRKALGDTRKALGDNKLEIGAVLAALLLVVLARR